VSPRPSPIVNHVLKGIVIMFYRIVSQVFYKLVVYVFVRPGSLSVEGQEPVVVYVITQNKLIKICKHHQVQTDHDE
jgi:hypothetical protein